MILKLQRYVLCTVILGFFTGVAAFHSVANDSTTTHRLAFQMGRGFLMPHRLPMQHLPQSHTTGFELSWDRVFSGSTPWHLAYNKPSMGFALYHSSLGNDVVLGRGTAIYGHLTTPLLHRPKWTLLMRWGCGLGYTSKRYNAQQNHKNVAIGSHLNIFASIKAGARWHINQNWDAFINTNFAHFSNTGLRFPNLGINLPSLQLGVGHSFDVTPKLKNKPQKTQSSSKSLWRFRAAVGMRSATLGDEQLYPAIHLAAFQEHETFTISSFQYGLDFFYNQAYGPLYEIKNRTTSHPNVFQMGVFGGYVQRIGMLHLYIDMGVYAVDQMKLNGLFYHRLGLRYLLSDRWNMNFNIMSHYAKADHFQVGIGYRIRR